MEPMQRTSCIIVGTYMASVTKNNIRFCSLSLFFFLHLSRSMFPARGRDSLAISQERQLFRWKNFPETFPEFSRKVNGIRRGKLQTRPRTPAVVRYFVCVRACTVVSGCFFYDNNNFTKLSVSSATCN